MGAGHQKAQAPDERGETGVRSPMANIMERPWEALKGKVWGASGSNVLMCQECTRPRKGTGTLCHPQPDTWP